MLWAGALLMLLAACGTASSPTSTSQSDGYLLTLKVSQGDTRDAVASKYGAEVIAWLGDQAILKLSDQAAAALPSRGISLQATTLEPNSTVKSPEVSAQGFSAWAGGFSAWAGGFSAWAGGWSAWAGGTSNLPTLPSQNRGESLQIKLPQGQALSKNFGSGVKVAVIDTGLDTTHPMFTGRLAPATEWKDFVDGDAVPQEVSGSAYGHGSAAAGLVLQAAPKATILPIRVLGPDGSGEVANVVSAIDWAIQKGANIINLSLGTTTAVSALQTIINTATAQGIYVVASAGNTSDSNITYPAAWAKTGSGAKYLLSVGSVNSSNGKSSFSSSGTALEFLAPGEGISSAYPGGQIASYTGTSFAAPQVAGAVALAMGDTASVNKGNLESYLLGSDTPVGGYGLINVAGLLQQLPDFVRRKALLVVGTMKLNSADSAVKAKLESLGYAVTVKDDKAKTTDATGKNIVLISETVDSHTVNSKFRSVTVPVVAWDDGVYDDMNLTGYNQGQDYDYTSYQTQLSISNSSHPLAAGLSGTVAAYSSQYDFTWGVPSSSAIKAATLTSNSSRAVIFGYDSGASMIGGFIAPARRVGLFISDFGADILTSQGAQLLEAAITWAVSGN